MNCDGSRSIPVWDGAGERPCPGCSACAGLPAVETTMRSSERAPTPCSDGGTSDRTVPAEAFLALDRAHTILQRDLADMTRWRDEALKILGERELVILDGEEARASAVSAFDALCSRMATIVDEAFGLQEVLPPEQLLTRLEELLFERRRQHEAAFGTVATLARKLGQALDTISGLGGVANIMAQGVLRSLTGEECRIIGRAAALNTDESRCAACGAEAHPEFGITVDDVARPLCTGCGDTDTRCCTPEHTAEREKLRANIRERDTAEMTEIMRAECEGSS